MRPLRAQVRYAGEVAVGPGKAELVKTEERILDARQVDATWGAAITGGDGWCCIMAQSWLGGM